MDPEALQKRTSGRFWNSRATNGSNPSTVGHMSTGQSIPFIYRLILTTIEPLFATLGAILAFTKPKSYLHVMARGGTAFENRTSFLYTELSGSWLYFAFVEAIVLRVYDDFTLWRLLCVGMLLSDAMYCHSTAQAVGGWKIWVDLSIWTAEDWTVFVTTAPMVLVRILIALEIGVKPASQLAAKRD